MEFSKFVRENLYLKNKIRILIKEVERLKRIIQNYETSITKELIRTSGNLQAIDIYLSKPQQIKKKKNFKVINPDYLNFINEENLNILTAATNHTEK